MLKDIINKKYSDVELDQIQNGVVSYFVATDNGYIKIGKSTYKSLPSRLSGIQTGNHRVLELIGILDGVKYSEDSLHKLFEKDRVRGEWFTYSENIQGYLNSIKTSQLVKSKDSDDMVSLPIKLNRLAILLYDNDVLLENYSKEDINDLINNTPLIIKPRHEKARFADLAKHLRNEVKLKPIDQVDWGNYNTRETWIDLLEQHYKLYGKVLTDYTKTKNMIEAGLSAEGQMKVDVQSVLKTCTLYSRKKIKEVLDKIYKKYKVKRKSSHRDLYTWFDCIEKRIKGYDYMEIVKKK